MFALLVTSFVGLGRHSHRLLSDVRENFRICYE